MACWWKVPAVAGDMNVTAVAVQCEREASVVERAGQDEVPHLVLANLSNGIMYPHDDVCYFASQMAHHKPFGYFHSHSMPLRAVITLLLGTHPIPNLCAKILRYSLRGSDNYSRRYKKRQATV